MDNNELQHWGIMGMKWGIRRYQNKDGTLTPAGKKRYDKEMEKLEKEEKILRNKQQTQAQLDKLDAKRKEINALKNPRKTTADEPDEESDTKKTASKNKGQLTTDELREKLARLELEVRIKNAELQLNPPPPEAKKGESFISKIGHKLAESGVDLGKQYLSEQIKKYFKEDDPLGDLKKEAEKAGLEGKIATNEMLKRKNRKEADEEKNAKRAEESAKKKAEESEKQQRVDSVIDIMKDFDGPIKNYTPGGKYKVNFDLSEYVSGYKSYNENYKSPTNSDYSNAGKSVVDNLLSDKDDD